MNFCTSCGTKLTEVSNFCANCGHRLGSTEEGERQRQPAIGDSMSTLSTGDRAQLILEAAGDPNLASSQIDELLRDHAPCFRAQLCAVCEYLDENMMDGLLDTLAGNPALTPSQQSQVWSYGNDWQGALVGVIQGFLSNPAISDEIKASTLAAQDFIAYHVGEDLEEWMHTYLEQMRRNPRFTKGEIAQFEATCAELD